MSENFGTIKDTGTACKESKIGAKIWEVFSLLRNENTNRLSISRLRGAGECIPLLPSVKTPHRPRPFIHPHPCPPSGICKRCAVKSLPWSPNRLADFGIHGNTAFLPKARYNFAMGGDDEAVRNGADAGESGADLELFGQLVATPPKK